MEWASTAPILCRFIFGHSTSCRVAFLFAVGSFDPAAFFVASIFLLRAMRYGGQALRGECRGGFTRKTNKEKSMKKSKQGAPDSARLFDASRARAGASTGVPAPTRVVSKNKARHVLSHASKSRQKPRLSGYRWRGCAIAERFRSDDAPIPRRVGRSSYTGGAASLHGGNGFPTRGERFPYTEQRVSLRGCGGNGTNKERKMK
jgi:hypothetical protein